MTYWKYKTVIEITEEELNRLGGQGWELVGITECRMRSVYDEDVPPTMDSPGELIGTEQVITGVMKRPDDAPCY